MDEDGLPIVGSGVDLTKVPAIQQRRIVAFLNQFIVYSVCFLNRFSTVCEEKLATISLRIQQIETTLSILEAKMSSIPGLEEVTVDQRLSTETNGPAIKPGSTVIPTASSLHSEDSSSGSWPISIRDLESYTTKGQNKEESLVSVQRQNSLYENKAEPDNVMTVAKDTRYARYLKMVQVGVPVMAIKNKMVLEGLDPNLLDSPDASVPDCGKKDMDEQDNNSSDSESSFSD